MPPKRSERTSSAADLDPPPVRRSARLHETKTSSDATASGTKTSSDATASGTKTSSTAPASGMAPPTRGLSNISTNTEASETWLTTATSAKQRLDKYVQREGRADDKLVAGLKAFLDYLPQGGRDSIAHDILDCKNDSELYEVFNNLRTGLLATMKTLSRASVTDSPFEESKSNVEHVASTLSDAQSSDINFQEDVFRRDAHCCVITKSMSFSHWLKIGEPADIYFADLEAAHIIPFALGSKNTIHTDHDRAKTWEVLYRCFPNVRKTGLTVENINNPSNGIALAYFIHWEFGKFRCALKKMEDPQKYELKLYKGFTSVLKPLLVSETILIERAEDNADVPFPNPDLLDYHYRVAEILNPSGMGDEIDRKLDEWDILKRSMPDGCLKEDGSTDVTHFLQAGLWQRAMG